MKKLLLSLIIALGLIIPCQGMNAHKSSNSALIEKIFNKNNINMYSIGGAAITAAIFLAIDLLIVEAGAGHELQEQFKNVKQSDEFIKRAAKTVADAWASLEKNCSLQHSKNKALNLLLKIALFTVIVLAGGAAGCGIKAYIDTKHLQDKEQDKEEKTEKNSHNNKEKNGKTEDNNTKDYKKQSQEKEQQEKRKLEEEKEEKEEKRDANPTCELQYYQNRNNIDYVSGWEKMSGILDEPFTKETTVTPTLIDGLLTRCKKCADTPDKISENEYVVNLFPDESSLGNKPRIKFRNKKTAELFINKFQSDATIKK